MRKDSKASGKETNIKLNRDKLLVDNKVNSETFQSNPIDHSFHSGESLDFNNLVHSAVIADKGSLFQGHVYPIFSLDQGAQALRAIMQDTTFAKSDHILYAYEFTDGDGQQSSGYCDDGEWSASVALRDMLKQRHINNVILIVSRIHGGTNLGKSRFDLIRRVAAEALDSFKHH